MTHQDCQAYRRKARIMLAAWGFVSYTAGLFTFMYIWCNSSELHRQDLVKFITFGHVRSEHVHK